MGFSTATAWRRWIAGLAVGGLALSMAAVVGAAPAPASTVGPATVIAIRTAHYSGFDRIVFEFNSAAKPSGTAKAVPVLIGDFTGEKVPIAGRGIIRVVLQGQAHTDDGRATVDTTQAFGLKNILAVRNAGDFEGVLTVGVGLAKKAAFHVHRLSSPGRFVVDVDNRFASTSRRVSFLDINRYAVGTEPYVRTVTRPVPSAYPAVGLLDRLFAGPTNAERTTGLRFVASRATGFADVRVADGIARVRLTGGCNSSGSTFTIAGEIMPTLRRLAAVDWIKIYDPAGSTETPTGHSDSIPVCLEP